MTIYRVPFLDVFSDESGGNIKTPQSEYLSNGRFPVIDQGKALIAGYVDDESRLCGSGRPAIVFGDHTRRLKYIDFPFCMGADGVKILRPKVEANLKYLYYYLKHLPLASAGYDRHFKYLVRTEVVLQPLAEQHRIAAILDQADRLRVKRREALAQLDTLAQAIFIEMFGSTNNFKFTTSGIRPFVEASSGKSSKSVLSVDRTNIPIYGGNGINGWALSALYEQPVLVFGRVGQYCGNAVITKGPSWVTDNAIVIRISDVSKLNEIYVLHAFAGSDFSNRVKHLDLPFINQSIILDNPIPLPPLHLQQIFASRIETIDALKATNREALSELDTLFASLQHLAFSGKL